MQGARLRVAPDILSADAFAQAYPARPVRIIVPYAVGTATDAAARMLAQRLAFVWGKGVTVDAMPGAGGAVGTQVLFKSAGDGYTLGVVAGAHAINAALYKNLPYDSLKDFKPVMNLAYTPLLIVINPNLPPRTVAELIAYSRAAGKPLNYGSGGTGSAPHLGMEYFLQMADVRFTHAPYKNLETVGHTGWREGGTRAARRVALHVDRHRVHGDVGGRYFDVHRERGGVAAQALRPDSQQVDRGR